jgi:hypothetical protein
VSRVADDGSSFVRSLAILLENVSYYFVLRYLIVEVETVLRCADYNHQIRLNSTGTDTSHEYWSLLAVSIRKNK